MGSSVCLFVGIVHCFECSSNIGSGQVLKTGVGVEKVTSISGMRFSRSMVEESDSAHAVLDSHRQCRRMCGFVASSAVATARGFGQCCFPATLDLRSKARCKENQNHDAHSAYIQETAAGKREFGDGFGTSIEDTAGTRQLAQNLRRIVFAGWGFSSCRKLS